MRTAGAGVLLSAGLATAIELRREHMLVEPLCAGLVLAWGAAVGFGAWHAVDPAARLADRAVMAPGLLDGHGFPSRVRNAVAWSIARNPHAPPDLLRQGRELVVDGVLVAYVGPRSSSGLSRTPRP